MEIFFLLIIVFGIGLSLYFANQSRLLAYREKLINSYQFPDKLKQEVAARYPHLKPEQINQVIESLREYFHICNDANKKFVSMPSQVVDVAWHEFILFTREYQLFCKKALGRFLHHTPAEAMEKPTQAQQGIKTTWQISCKREGINPNRPQRLPLLFAIDSALEIEDGFVYSLNCLNTKGKAYCASHIGNSSGGCGGGSNASMADSSSDGGSGCGGGGCGS